jgi:hypothetical protein
MQARQRIDDKRPTLVHKVSERQISGTSEKMFVHDDMHIGHVPECHLHNQ